VLSPEWEVSSHKRRHLSVYLRAIHTEVSSVINLVNPPVVHLPRSLEYPANADRRSFGPLSIMRHRKAIFDITI
jgi:hypothetical protein